MYPLAPHEHLVENRNCKQCSGVFPITDKDIEFYEKVSPVYGGKKYIIPSPTLCPECRQQRRQSFKNIYHLYKNEKTGIISPFSPDKDYHVVSQEIWWGDADLGLKNGKDFDFSRRFFNQFAELQKVAPRWNLIQITSENCDWCVNMSGSKNCYSVKSGGGDENCYYGERVFNSKDAVDGVRIDDTSNCYDSYNIHDCYGIAFSNNVSDAKLSMYITDCKNVSDCIGCIGLENKNHYILNKPVTKEEFQSTWSNILSSSNYRQEFLKKYNELLTIFPRRALIIEGSEDAYGDEIFNSKNVWYGFGIRDVENTKYAYDEAGSRDTMDVNGDDLGELSYECSSNYAPRHTSFSFNNANVTDCYYVETSINLRNCFGCVGLHDKSYCILNKQYTKEEYEVLVPKIIEKMMQDGEWGEFFPATMSPYGYNESEAMEYYPIDKEDALKNGIFKWSDYMAPVPKVEKTIPASKLPEDIIKIPDDVLNWAIECEVTKRPFRIIKQELEFYRKHSLPLPRRHPDQRHRDRMGLRHERKLYNRLCEKCQCDIITTYGNGRQEKVYCESCYRKIIIN